jgi:hypothetical protein
VKGHVVRCHRKKPPRRSVLQPKASAEVGGSARLAGDDAIAAVTPTDAPLQADQAGTSVAYGEEYHVWPAAAAGAWMLLAGHAAPLFG